MTSTIDSPNSRELSEEELIARFLSDNVDYIGPDSEMIADHHIQPRTAREDAALSTLADSPMIDDIRITLQAMLNEQYEIVEKMAVSSAASAGDLTVTVFSAAGDLSLACLRGVVGFSAAGGYPIRYVLKYFSDDVLEGTAWINSDPFYGGLHSPDQAIYLPIFWDGEVVAWASVGMHEGENGAREPGGMGPGIESPFEQGLLLPPIRFADDRRIRPDFLNMMQNNSRDKRLIAADLKLRMAVICNVEKRVHTLCEEFGADAVVATLRKNVEYISSEVARRVEELPDATVRVQTFLDSTMREDVVLRYAATFTVKGGTLTVDYSGSSPQIGNRPINSPVTAIKIGIMMGILSFVWPDLPRSLAVLDPIEVIAPERTVVNASPEVPTCLNLQTIFQAITHTQLALNKLGFGVPVRYGMPMGAWYNQPISFVYGGITQHHEQVGNLCLQLNGMPGGARFNADGEHSMSPNFAAKVEIGETEWVEANLPFVELIAKRLLTDNVGFGRYRGGGGFEFALANRFSPFWSFQGIAGGSRIPTALGLFGGYAAPVHPASIIRGIDVFEVLDEQPELFKTSIVELMNGRPFEGAEYLTCPGAVPAQMAERGELFMMAQGAGGGYGDVLERAPEAVMRDLVEGVISHETARDLYIVVYDADRMTVDVAATERARDAARADRLANSLPYDQFVAQWNKPAPPEGLPFFGTWAENRDTVWANGVAYPADEVPPLLMMPDPKDVKLAALQAQVEAQNT